MAQLLREKGYRAYALEGGLQAWYDAGYPLEPKAAERGRTAASSTDGGGRRWPA